ERRIYLIKHAEWGRIELEDREHQGDGGQRLFPTRQQVNGAVLLARGPCHDGDTGIQQVVAGELQPGAAAAEYLRKQVLQPTIDLVEGLLEAAAGFPIDLADDLLQCIQRLYQVRVLRVQVV